MPTVLGFGIGVFLPQPAPHSFLHASQPFYEHAEAVGILKKQPIHPLTRRLMLAKNSSGSSHWVLRALLHGSVAAAIGGGFTVRVAFHPHLADLGGGDGHTGRFSPAVPLRDADGTQTGRGLLVALLKGDMLAAGEEADENVYYDPLVVLVKDGARSEVAFEGAEGFFDANEMDVVAPEFAGARSGEVASRQIPAFVTAGGLGFYGTSSMRIASVPTDSPKTGSLRMTIWMQTDRLSRLHPQVLRRPVSVTGPLTSTSKQMLVRS
jgi:hypothetical protein